jgi:hypothetical protein
VCTDYNLQGAKDQNPVPSIFALVRAGAPREAKLGKLRLPLAIFATWRLPNIGRKTCLLYRIYSCTPTACQKSGPNKLYLNNYEEEKPKEG